MTDVADNDHHLLNISKHQIRRRRKSKGGNSVGVRSLINVTSTAAVSPLAPSSSSSSWRLDNNDEIHTPTSIVTNHNRESFLIANSDGSQQSCRSKFNGSSRKRPLMKLSSSSSIDQTAKVAAAKLSASQRMSTACFQLSLMVSLSISIILFLLFFQQPIQIEASTQELGASSSIRRLIPSVSSGNSYGKSFLASQKIKRQISEDNDESTTTTESSSSSISTLSEEATTERASTTEPTTTESTTPESTTTTTTTTAPSTTTTPTTTTATRGSSLGNKKIPPINFTLVDELFDAVLEESEVAAKWRHMDRQLTDGVRAILKAVFPHIVAMSQDAKVSGNCSGAILKWILNLRNLRSWAVKMLDAIGKPSAGLLEGSLTLFGNYKQCLSVRAPDEDEIEIVEEFREYFRGQYCVLQMKPYLPKKPTFYSLNSTIPSLVRNPSSFKYYEKAVYDELSELAMAFHFITIRADLCVPSLCSRDDIQRVADFLAKKVDMRARVLRCDVEPMDEDSIVDTSQIIWASMFIILLLLVILSSLTSFLFQLRRRQTKSKSHSLFTVMSVSRSINHMKNVQLDRINSQKPALLYSLRLIVIFWIFLVSLVSQLDFQYLRELLSLRSVIMQWPMQIIVNSSLAYETLILLTAFTYSYQNIDCNLIDLVKYNIGKYSRLMPSIMLFVAITIITPLLYQNKSPVWHDFVDKPAQVCKQNGIYNVFFLQNFLNYDQICLPQTWLFCVELQLCILAIPIVYLLNKNFDTNQGQFKLVSLPTIALILAALFGCFMNFQTIYQNSLPGTWFQTYPDKQDKNYYYSIYLTKTWSHLSSFAVGLFAGHLCRCLAIDTFSGRPYGRKCCDNLIWATSLLLMAALIFSTHTWSLSGQSHIESPIKSALYGSLSQLLWSLSLAMMLFNLTVPNDKNQSSNIARLLSLDTNMIRLGRLAFLAYLINPYVNTIVFAAQEQAIFSSIIMLGHTFIGNFVITFGLAFVVSALIELPCRRLVKKFLLGSRRHCTNLGVITRQLNIHQQNQGPSHDSFTAQEKQRAAHTPMIPLR